MLKEGLSPGVAFKAADLNHNGVVTLDELREVIKRLVPEEALSLNDLKQIMLAFDSNKNGLIEEDEFIKAFERARDLTVVYLESPQKVEKLRVDNDRREKLPLKSSQVKETTGAAGISEQQVKSII